MCRGAIRSAADAVASRSATLGWEVRGLLSILDLPRITFDPAVMGGRPCLRGLRVTVGMIVGLIAAGHSTEEILALYPYLEADDVRQALAYAAWRAEERELPAANE